jgi:sialate O-acetylesterase
VLPAVTAGGPYRIELRLCDDAGKVLESLAVSDILVGDVWVLAGQSNMQGVGNQKDMETPHPQVHTFSMSYEWRVAQEPLHTLAESPDTVHANFANDEERQNAIKGWRDGSKGAGLGLPFAVEMVKRTGRPVGLIAAAHGGTSMQQWDPAKKGEGGASLYGSMCKQVAAAGGKVRGVLWYQGESDANPDAQPIFREACKRLVAAMRADFGVANLPFYYVQIGRFVINNDNAAAWNAVQADELAMESELAPGGMVASVDLSLDDLIHAGTSGLKTLGYRLANLAERDLFAGQIKAGPRFEKMEALGTPYGRQLRVKFASVNGVLQAAGRPNGFSISSKIDGADAPCIYNMEIAKDDPTVVVLWVQEFPEDPYLWYGRGFNPYCNIVDGANMAMPVMGPIQIPAAK